MSEGEDRAVEFAAQRDVFIKWVASLTDDQIFDIGQDIYAGIKARLMMSGGFVGDDLEPVEEEMRQMQDEQEGRNVC